MELDLDGELVRLAYHFVANGSEDYPSAKQHDGLQAIRVEPHEDGAVIVACDGAWMFVAIDKSGYCDEPLNLSITVPIHCKLKPSTADKIRVKATRKSGLTLWTRVSRTIAKQSERWLAANQDFPNWRQVIPDVSQRMPTHFPAMIGLRYLSLIGRVWDDTNRRSNKAVFLGRSEKQAIAVYFPDMQNIMLVGMPVSGDIEKPSFDWSAKFSQPAPEINDDL